MVRGLQRVLDIAFKRAGDALPTWQDDHLGRLRWNPSTNKLAIGGTSAWEDVNSGSGVGVVFGGWVSQDYYSLAAMVGGADGVTAGVALVANQMNASLFPVPVATTFDQVAIQVTAAVAASTIRLGVYTVGTNGLPGALIADWGTVSSAAIATPTLAISWAPVAGWYYLVQVASSTPSTIRMAGGLPVSPFGNTTPVLTGATDWFRTSALSSAALPSTFGSSPTATGTHRPIWLRKT